MPESEVNFLSVEDTPFPVPRERAQIQEWLPDSNGHPHRNHKFLEIRMLNLGVS